MLREWVWIVASFSLVACGGQAATYEFVTIDGGVTAQAGSRDLGSAGSFAAGSGSSFAGAAGSGGSNSVAGQGGQGANGGTAEGGSAAGFGGAPESGGSGDGDAGGVSGVGGAAGAGTAGTGGSAGTSGVGIAGAGGGRACGGVPDCPKPPNSCMVATCLGMRCGTRNAVAGSVFILDTPADCHATTACDGAGNATIVVDQDNVPTSSNPCVVGTCNGSGTAGTEPLPIGIRCTSATGGALCDGAGTCVQCLHAADCPSGQSCATTHACVAAALCTDVACGGVCPQCGNGKKCGRDSDCESNACDAVTLTCISNQCGDHRQDGQETDADCGGRLCPPCAIGQRCGDDSDCVAPQACDGISRTCVTNPCVDHQVDYNETDVDCGGADSCLRCRVGQFCKNNTDCRPGLTCSVTSPQECQ